MGTSASAPSASSRATDGVRTASRLASSLALGVLLFHAPPAAAQPSSACLEAADRAQELRDGGKLLAAKAQLVICSRPECPSVIRQDCAQWMNEVAAATPTVVFGAHDPGGRDLFAVRVLVDGVEVARSLDGMAVPLDPGRHVVRFEADGFAPSEEAVLVRLGDKQRQLTRVLAPSSGEAKRPVTSPGDDGDPQRPIPTSVVVLGGLGVAALGTAGVLDWIATSDALDFKRTCAPHCSDEQLDPVRTKYTIAAIAAGAGVVALGTAAVLYFTRPARAAAGKAPPRATSARFDMMPLDRGAALGVHTCF